MDSITTNNNHSEVLHTAAELRDLVDLAEWGGELLNRHVTVSEAAGWRLALGDQAERVPGVLLLADEPVAA